MFGNIFKKRKETYKDISENEIKLILDTFSDNNIKIESQETISVNEIKGTDLEEEIQAFSITSKTKDKSDKNYDHNVQSEALYNALLGLKTKHNICNNCVAIITINGDIIYEYLFYHYGIDD